MKTIVEPKGKTLPHPEVKGVVFVKGRTFVFLKAQDLTAAKKTAEDIAGEIPRKR